MQAALLANGNAKEKTALLKLFACYVLSPERGQALWTEYVLGNISRL